MRQIKQRADYTFKYNKNLERHGWLRLTPAYSVKLVKEIERWWAPQTLSILSAIRNTIADELGEPQQDDPNALVWIAFCRLVMDTSAAAFNHVSMSFHDDVTKMWP